MKDFITYLKNYLSHLSLKSAIATLLITGVLVICNYTFGIENRIRDIHPWYLSLFSFFFFYSFVFYLAWALTGTPRFDTHTRRSRFLLVLLIAPLYFSFKMIHWDLSRILPAGIRYPWDRYALIVLQLPAKLLLLCLVLWWCAKWMPLNLLTTKNFRPGPYFIILILLLPLIALALWFGVLTAGEVLFDWTA